MASDSAATRLKRAYDEPAPEDGTRVLVERLWPRGLSRERARIDLWPREVAPSDALRRWYGHDPARWEEFRRHYLVELEGDEQRAALSRLRELAHKGPVTLVFATKDVAHSGAFVLHEALQREAGG
jgi:uncharacterized protein YeaO (DUF488 family)